jgi:NAD-dependent dihydropyrimidine dehydrogenase PreA subunit
MGRDADKITGRHTMTLQYIRGIVTLQYNEARCIGCGICVDVCPHAVFIMEGKKAKVIERDNCMECGACAKNCPATAIAVESGVGCVSAIIQGAIRGSEPNCDCCCGD